MKFHESNTYLDTCPQLTDEQRLLTDDRHMLTADQERSLDAVVYAACEHIKAHRAIKGCEAILESERMPNVVRLSDVRLAYRSLEVA